MRDPPNKRNGLVEGNKHPSAPSGIELAERKVTSFEIGFLCRHVANPSLLHRRDQNTQKPSGALDSMDMPGRTYEIRQIERSVARARADIRDAIASAQFRAAPAIKDAGP